MRLLDLPKKHLLYILAAAAVIIFASSMETLLRVKDSGLFEKWLSGYEQAEGIKLAHEEAYSMYVTASLSYYFYKIVTPMALAIYSYFAYTKLKINSLFIFIGTVLVLGGMVQTLVEWNFYSAFYYLNLAGFGVLAAAIVSLFSLLDRSKS